MKGLKAVLVRISLAVLAVCVLLLVGAAFALATIAVQERKNEELALAFYNSNLTEAQALIDAGADPNTKMYPNGWFFDRIVRRQGGAPLIFSSLVHGDVAGAQLLLDNGVDPNSGERYGGLLFIAANHGHVGVVQALLDAGADSNVAPTRSNNTPLHQAAYRGYDDVVKALLAAGANPNAIDSKGRSPLHRAAAGWVPQPPPPRTNQSDNWVNAGHHKAVIELMLKAGARVDMTDIEGKAPQQYALAEGHDDLAALLASSVPQGD